MNKFSKLMIGIFLLTGSIFFGCKKKNADPITPAPVPPTVTAFTYYVSPVTGSDGNNGLTEAAPFRSIQKAAGIVSAGDVVLLMNGSYLSGTISVLRSGTKDKYITFKAFPGHTPKIFGVDIWNTLSINASYFIVDGIEFIGNNQNLTLAGATTAYNTQFAGGAARPDYNTNGISIGGPAAESKRPHHVIIRNCKVHDFPGGGISSIQADYTTIESNTVYNNAWYMVYAGSGISILTPYDVDAVTTYKNIVRNNICYNNKTMIPWISLNPPRLSDGNGIIIDVNTRPYNTPVGTGPAYVGRTLVENNVSYNNGGSGIHAFDAAHIDIINNTAYNNGQIVDYPEIFSNRGNDVKIINNIMYAKNGGKCNSNSNNVNVTYDYNIYFNGSVTGAVANNKTVDPQFILLSADPAVANFLLRNGSPAVNGGTQSIFAPKDILGNARPKGATVDCGAYEVN